MHIAYVYKVLGHFPTFLIDALHFLVCFSLWPLLLCSSSIVGPQGRGGGGIGHSCPANLNPPSSHFYLLVKIKQIIKTGPGWAKVRVSVTENGVQCLFLHIFSRPLARPFSRPDQGKSGTFLGTYWTPAEQEICWRGKLFLKGTCCEILTSDFVHERIESVSTKFGWKYHSRNLRPWFRESFLMRISFKTLSCPKEPINEVKQYLSMNCNRKHSNLPLLSSHFHLFYFFSGSWAGKKGWAGGKGGWGWAGKMPPIN